MNTITTFIQKHPAITIIIAFQLFRFCLLPSMGLMPQDAYYHFYGENLSLSYFDHPGMIGYILRLFTLTFGKSVFVVKLANFVITTLTIVSFYKLSTLFLSKDKILKSLLLLVSTLFVSILSFNSTPDVPLMLFWTLSVLFLYRAIFEDKKAYWIYAGITMGLAFDSKYTALLLQLGLIAFVLFSNQKRKLLLSPWFWACLIISVLVTFPVWWWNYQHDFASFLFQSSERTSSMSGFKVHPNFFFGALGHQLLLLLPILFSIFLVFTFKYVKRALVKFKLPSTKTLFLLAFFIPTFLGFMLLTPFYWVKLNWLMPSYITGIILASMLITRKLLKIQLIISVVLHFLVALQVVFYIVPIKSDDTWVGWEELALETQKIQNKYPDSFIFSDDKYKTSAVLNFYMNDKVYAQNIIGKHALHFDYLGDDLSTLNGKNAIFIDSDKRFKNNDKKEEVNPLLKNYFSSITQLEPIIIKKNGKKLRKFWVFYCEKYRTNP
ncbi:Dolichyl-phosphate-mannose-protein mannosyltransferase [Tenacibaculum sp. MAR_2009_124]|uniref:glycosyltransferase family 39 protein n=1 Tax=Tenacibaculum sp. MAR_2009_124 TaxID=1250059 RepID=UPI000898B330|nr:glycosyltransferase family 39 protein [Tenacibaculum sp. MAR_2009_124]SEB37274.1 Dolichyl-phosphate-mannose-protein mannosyltransferase [Tenacibaculum sp. MAR_2009_124]